MKPKIYLKFYLTLLLAVICMHTIAQTAPAPLADSTFVAVLEKDDPFTNDGQALGMIRSKENGNTGNCFLPDVIGKLRTAARARGANLIRITEVKESDQWSPCDRITAQLYLVPDFRKHEQRIEWDSSRRLTWTDFKAAPDENAAAHIAAITNCGLGFQTNRVSQVKKLRFYVSNSFDCSKSWIRPEFMGHENLLAHEQGHFDICEIYARQLRKRFRESSFELKTLSEQANDIFREVYNLYVKRQQEYETDTDNGRNREQQRLWTAKIAVEIMALHDFAN